MQIFRFTLFVSWWWTVLALTLFIISLLKPKLLFTVIAFVAGLLLAFTRASSDLADERYIQQFYNQTVIISGTISGDLDIDEGNIKFRLADLQFGETNTITRRGVVFVSLKSNSSLERGDKISLKGKLLEGFGIYAGSLYRPTIIKWEKPNPGDLTLKIRNWFAKRITDIISNPEAGLGLSYLLGIKSDLSKELEENLRTSGLVHLVVTSGTHLAILVSLIRKTFGKISRFFGVLLSIIFILVFMCMTGFTPSITRAGVMTILALLAWYSGRRFSSWRIIIIVAAATLLYDPSNLINLGWQLSFASYGGVTIIGPKLNTFFYGKKKPGFIGSKILTSISAMLTTLPIVLFYYGQISLLSIITNLLITPTLAYVMGLTFLSGIVANIPFLKEASSFLAGKALGAHIVIIEWFGKMKEFLVEIPKENPATFLLYIPIIVLVLISLVASYMRRHNLKRMV